MPEASLTHAELVKIALRWLQKSRRCPVVFAEHVTRLNYIPDAIGWNWDWSILVECKVSRRDFFADQDKPIHKNPDGYPGQERWFLTPPGLIKLEELPLGWRLAETSGKRVRMLSRPPNWDELNVVPERSRMELPLLLSAVRRHSLGVRWLAEEGRFESIAKRDRRLEIEALRERMDGAGGYEGSSSRSMRG